MNAQTQRKDLNERKEGKETRGTGRSQRAYTRMTEEQEEQQMNAHEIADNSITPGASALCSPLLC